MRCYVYDTRMSADYETSKHPPREMLDLGLDIIGDIPQPIADNWVFCVKNDNDVELPPYIEPIEWDERFDNKMFRYDLR